MHRLLLIRHAVAEDRQSWIGDDAKRPLTRKGHRQAERLAQIVPTLIEPLSEMFVQTSPAVRCVQTVEPLAQALNVMLERHPGLMEGNEIQPPSPLDGTVHILCAHGDNIPWLLEHLGIDWNQRCKKGSLWMITRDQKGRVIDSDYRTIAKE